VFLQFITIWPAGEQGVRYRAIVGGYSWQARAPDVVLIARGYGATAAIAFAAARWPRELTGEEGQSAARSAIERTQTMRKSETSARRSRMS
jgi:hypothetical protein